MRWFRGSAEAPRLLSLSPLYADEESEDATLHSQADFRLKDMSPMRWTRRKSSSSESERNCYNVQTSQITTERTSHKKDKKRIQEERKRTCEKRNPLFDRVKNTRLSFFGDKHAKNRERESDDIENDEDDVEAVEKTQFHSMSQLSTRGLTRNNFRRSMCELDLKHIANNDKIQSKRKRRCKSQSRISSKKDNERLNFLGFAGSTSTTAVSKPDGNEAGKVNSPKTARRKRWGRGKEKDDDCISANKLTNDVTPSTEEPEVTVEYEISRYDNAMGSSCLAAKFRAIQDRYLKSSTNKLIAKIYRKDAKDRDKRRLRSLSYGTLLGLDELRTNPLYDDEEQDDNDSGILDNGSATSSLLDDRYGSSASPFLTITNDGSSSSIPPRLPPRRVSTSTLATEKKWPFNRVDTSLQFTEYQFPDLTRDDVTKHCETRSTMHKFPLDVGVESPSGTIHQASNEELIQQQIEVEADSQNQRGRERKDIPVERDRENFPKNNRKSLNELRLSVIRSRTYTTEMTIVKLPRESVNQCLGIFIAKTPQSSPGYLVAHVVPNGLADLEGTLKIGDEILIVNGKRLRGLNMAEARNILGKGSGPGEVEIVVLRKLAIDSPKKLKESSVDYENVCVENGHIVTDDNINNNNNNNNNNIDTNDNTDNNSTDQLDYSGMPRPHFCKRNSRHHRDRKNESNRSICLEKRSIDITDGGQQHVSNFCTLPRKPRNTVSTFHTVVLEKGHGKKSLGFTIVGGRDSPKGSIGIFIKSVLPGGQAGEDGRLRAGDEILAVNGQVSHDLTHREAVQLFRNIKSGSIALHICRRAKNREIPMPKAKSCADLLLMDT